MDWINILKMVAMILSGVSAFSVLWLTMMYYMVDE